MPRKRYEADPHARYVGRYQALLQPLESSSRFMGCELKTIGETDVGPILRIDYRMDMEEPWLMIVAGQHGDEPSGPFMIQESIRVLCSEARKNQIGLRIYPCVNPEGFDRKTRFNGNNETDTNNFIEYEIKPGVWKGELPFSDTAGAGFLNWRFVKPSRDAAREMLELRDDINKYPAPVAAIDLHQDHHETGSEGYTWIEGPREPLVEIQRAVFDNPWRDKRIVASWTDQKLSTDKDGLITFYDGTLQDWLYRKGARWTVTLETNPGEFLFRTKKIAFDWCQGLIELVGNASRKNMQ